MDKLIAAGLFGDGLVAVDTPTLVRRYNEALEEAGIEPTDLAFFNVDGLGWSPEIAQRRDDMLYLSHGVANQIGIIISPKQDGRPIYTPFRSFDRQLMIDFFEANREAIVDATTDGYILLDIDQEISRYRNPRDLLLVNHFTVRSSTGKRSRHAAEQRSLIERFLKEEDAWADDELRQQIIKNAQAYGDMRRRHLVIPDHPFLDLRNFYTRAFGGVFVLRGQSDERILVLKDPKLAKEAAKGEGVIIETMSSDTLITTMIKAGLFEIDLDWYRDNPDALRDRYNNLVIHFLCIQDAKLDTTDLTPSKIRRLLQDADDTPDVIFEMEGLRSKLNQGMKVRVDELHPDLRLALLHPAGSLSKASQAAVWQLLMNFQPWSMLYRYIFDREQFIKSFPFWTDSLQDWSVSLIKERYRKKFTR